MITREINEWIKNVECGRYSYEDAMYEFQNFAKYLTREELQIIQKKLQNLM